MQVLEDRAGWEATFKANWLAHLQATGETNFKLYEYSRNEGGIPGKAIDLSRSRMLFVTTAGGYLKASQQPFDAPNLIGDYTLRIFPLSTPLDALAFAHDHYDHRYVKEDPQVLVPLRHLEAMVNEGEIGAVVPEVISFAGYMPDVPRLLDEVIPQVVGMAKDRQADAALLVPA